MIKTCLDNTFVLYSTCQTIKDGLIGSLLFFYKSEDEEKCQFWDLFSTFIISQTNLKNTHFLL